jgi:hypothetical protein
MATQKSDNVGSAALLGSIVETFRVMFINSSVFFISLCLLIMLVRLFVRLATGNYWGAMPEEQIGLVAIGSAILALSHLFLTLSYTSEDMKDFATAPSYYWAVCWSMAILSGVCGGLGVGLLVLKGLIQAI